MIKSFLKKLLPSFLLNLYHFSLAFLGALLYGRPSKKIKVIGVTGTNGKTTTTEMITQILEEAGFKVALINSIRFQIGEEKKENKLRMTMPGRFFIQRFLKKALNVKCQYAIIEVTSEGILQYRHKFIDFDIALFTNLSPEHIERHGSFEKYKECKGELFKSCKKIHIINLDDAHKDYFLRFPAKEKYCYTIKNQESGIKNRELNENMEIIKAERIETREDYFSFVIRNSLFKIHLIGQFNIYNALAAICVGLSQGIKLETCKSALEKFGGVPGRMEEVISQPFKVIVDYAFTSNALEKVYQEIYSKLKTQNAKLICVLGACGGGRDKWKRPILGKIAKRYCQEIIVTNEDPYDEEPMEIIKQVAEGAGERAKKILDRREAIKEALKLARDGDIVIITGKGSESSIVVKDREIPWDDRKVVREEFEKLNTE